MYSLEEIKYQNQQDSFTLMLYMISKSLLNCLGEKGNCIIRKSIRDFGFTEGEETRKLVIQKGKLPNLRSMVELENRFIDPRFRFMPIRATEQELWFEVHTCPVSDYLNIRNGKDIGLMFCEEFCHAYFEGYSEGKAQTNLSKTLMCQYDNHCRFSIYYRPANVNKSDREKIFHLVDCEDKALLPEQNLQRNSKKLGLSYLKVYVFILRNAKEFSGFSGECAVATGLRKLAEMQSEELKRWSEATKNPMNEQFIKLNFPVDIFKGKEICEEAGMSETEISFFCINFWDRLMKRLFYNE